jgi:Na+-translocating ferredoxin:NAD+ oxidoreductase subunit B
MAVAYSILTASLLMAGLGVGLAGVLAFANRKMFVYEDPRIDIVESLLPNANCGACGSAGCRVFAESVVAGELAPGKCTANSDQVTDALAGYLGVDAGGGEKQVARLACAGGNHVSWTRARYQGMETCRGASLIAGGGKGCSWGCLGLGDCEVVCGFDAISMDAFGLPVVDTERCTACNKCVEVCPRLLFSLQPLNHRLWVACKNLAEGEAAEAECDVACTACGRCEADAPGGLVTMAGNLPVVDYGKNDLATPGVIQRCPTGAIVWLTKERGARRGADAKKTTRKTALPILME